MIYLAVFLMGVSPTSARPRDCVAYLLGRWRALTGRPAGEGASVFDSLGAYRRQLKDEVASARAAFENLPPGTFKVRLAIHEMSRRSVELGRLAGEWDFRTREASLKISLKDRHDLYYIYLIQLFYDPGLRAELLDLPPELIREAARAVAHAEAGEGFTLQRAFPGWFLHWIDVDPILAERDRRRTESGF